MPNLHAHYYHGNIKAFRQELDGTASTAAGNSSGGGKGGNGGWNGPGSASAGRSWTLSGMSQVPTKGDPNERDGMGRTVLHLAASTNTQVAYTFFSILLRNQHISVNLQDQESGYTALHRALFVGNIRAARDLLLRNDIDPSIKDLEGMTAFDLYNGTVDGTNPPHDVDGTDLYVWGVNRNFALGIGDSSDKAYPDRVNLLTQAKASGKEDSMKRFHHVGVKDVVMAKLHTGAITTEQRGNLSLCGFGSNGRLGRSVHSQLSLTPMPDLPHNITSVALAQDHSLALTSGGYILSWGHNRFAQLGYVIDAPEKPVGFGKDDQEIQVSPRRIVGPLKKEWVKGVAAGRLSSVCWTEDAVWTWGTNAGHLGYDKAANPVQVLPRKVTAITQPVIDVAVSDYAMICLLDTNEVVCFHHDANFKISFSTPKIFSDVPFRPPQSTLKPMIKKITSCGITFAALSSIGDVFTFTLPNPLEDISKDAKERHVTVKPQLIWALRKNFTAVKDVALGSDGTVIICTHSGHVYVRQRVKSGAGQLKFKRIPYLQRVVKVACNESGAFSAIRVDAKAKPIALAGKRLEEDLFMLQPHFRRFRNQMTAEDFDHRSGKTEDEEEDEGSNSVAKDSIIALQLCAIIKRWRTDDDDTLFSWSEHLLGSDIKLVIGDLAIPAHSIILCSRIPIFAKFLSGTAKIARFSIGTDRSIINVDACHPLVALLLLQYIYSDDIAAIWDARVGRTIQAKYADLKLPLAQIKADLRSISDILNLAPLSTVLNLNGKQPITTHTLPQDLQSFFTKTYQSPSESTDVTLILADKSVECSSVILRSRCPFFEAMFADSDWTAQRQGQGRVVIKMEHLKWRPMKLVFKFIHHGTEDDLFDYLHQENLDEFLDFVFEVLAAATELLLDRLVLVCSRVIIRHCNAFNAAALACEANFYQAETLKLSIFDYIIASMETMLESGLLDDMDEDTLNDLVRVIEEKQSRKLSISRNNLLLIQSTEKHKDWLALQDFPTPRVRQPYKWRPRSPLLSPTQPTGPLRGRVTPSPVNSPELEPLRSISTIEDIFSMDDDSTVTSSPPITSSSKNSRPITPLDLASGATPKSAGPVWRSSAVEAQKVDLRSIMAEAQSVKTPIKTPMNRSTPGATPASSSRPPLGSSPSATPTKSSPILGKTPPSSAGPWRPMETRKTSLSSVQQAQQSAPGSSSRPSAAQPSPIPVRTPSHQVITPVKLQQSPITQRKSSGSAWTTTATFAPPVVQPGPTSPDARSFSLLAIQQEEKDFADRSVNKKPLKSLAEIQEEERSAQSAQAQELEFMRWWQEEEARVKKEQGGGATSSMAPTRGGRGGRGGAQAGQKRVPPNRGRRGGMRGGKVASQQSASASAPVATITATTVTPTSKNNGPSLNVNATPFRIGGSAPGGSTTPGGGGTPQTPRKSVPASNGN